jgi:CelD/BcsL family acetyltransferase involved in cellulose biosynthesis
MDPALMIAREAFPCMAEKEPKFNWDAWLLEVDGQTVAYVIVCLFKEWAIFAKSSYDAQYRRFSPGLYTINTAIQELLDERHVKKFDFLTDLPFLSTWTSQSFPRVRALVYRKGLLSVILNAGVRLRPSVKRIAPLRQFCKSLLDFP